MDRAVRLTIVGRVQGVGYRAWAAEIAAGLDLRGWVRNRFEGSVEVFIAGHEQAVARMIDACRHGPSLARVDGIDQSAADLADAPADFRLRPTA